METSLQHQKSENQLPLTVLGGALGSGKTTLINNLLRHANGRRLAILVNEFGDLPIDADLIEAQSDQLISLTGGCVCCSFGDDLGSAIQTLRNLTPQPQHLILEASGVALPGGVAASLALMSGIDLLGVVVLADATRIEPLLNDTYLGDTTERQLQDADLILISKVDLVNPSGISHLEELITQHAPRCPVVPCAIEGAPNDLILKPLSNPGTHTCSDITMDHLIVQSSIYTPTSAIDVEAYAKRLAADESVVRAKGHLMRLDCNELVTLQLVADRYEITPAPHDADPGVVELRISPTH